jgi:hypothetical protein
MIEKQLIIHRDIKYSMMLLKLLWIIRIVKNGHYRYMKTNNEVYMNLDGKVLIMSW